MKRTAAGLSRHMALAVVAALLVAIVFAGTVSAMPAEPLAPDVPNLPHCFWGTVSTNRGIPLPGMPVTAMAVSGYWKGQVATTVNAQSQYSFCVPGYDSSTGAGAKQGDLIESFVNGVPALLVDVATGQTSTAYPFVYGGRTQLNLFITLQETIEATAGPNCTINPAGSVRADYGMDQTFTFAGVPGYQVERLFVDDVATPEAAAAGSFTFQNVRRSHTIRVECIKSTWTITATAGQGCTIAPSGAQTVPVHTNITFAIGAQTGFNLTGVTVDAVSKGPITTFTFTDVVADHAIAAACTRQILAVTPEWGTGGKIVPGTPQMVLFGDSVTFQIQPDTGFVVEDVLVNGVSTGAVTTYTFTNVTANATIKATFKPQTFTVTPEAGPNGKIVPGTAQTVLYGGNVTFEIQPDQGYVVFDVLVNGVSQGARSSYTFENVTANGTIKAIFAKQIFKLFLPVVMG